MCIACKQLFPRQNLFKLTALSNADGSRELCFDSDQHIPGRSLYIHKAKDCLHKLQSHQKHFSQALRRLHLTTKNTASQGEIISILYDLAPSVNCPYHHYHRHTNKQQRGKNT